MHREGVDIKTVTTFLHSATFQRAEQSLVGVASHYASANDLTDTRYIAQNTIFDQAIEQFANAKFTAKFTHIQASAGALRNLNNKANSIRMGLGMYGISPLQTTDFGLKPVLILESTIAQIKKIKKNGAVGYNGSYTAKKNSTIALISIGHSDGIDRRLGNHGVVSIHGCLCPIIGNASMNVTAVDISQCPNAQVGDSVKIISSAEHDPNSVKSFAEICRTTADEFLAHLGPGIKRVVN
jgi:alanine racemase